MAKITYESETITEWDDGTTDVRFREEEWIAMHKDPVYFGLACHAGHRLSQAEGNNGFCGRCEAQAEYEGLIPADYPMIRCGHCKGYHVGVGAVERCSRRV
jgi:hypothetical protein